MNSNDRIETIPLVAYEAEAARYSRTIRLIAAGWTASVLILSAAIACVLIL